MLGCMFVTLLKKSPFGFLVSICRYWARRAHCSGHQATDLSSTSSTTPRVLCVVVFVYFPAFSRRYHTNFVASSRTHERSQRCHITNIPHERYLIVLSSVPSLPAEEYIMINALRFRRRSVSFSIVQVGRDRTTRSYIEQLQSSFPDIGARSKEVVWRVIYLFSGHRVTRRLRIVATAKETFSRSQKIFFPNDAKHRLSPPVVTIQEENRRSYHNDSKR
jgi:hypothetical protein